MIEAVGNYMLLERLSVHQNREVWLGEDPEGRTVIVKRLRLGQMQDWKALELFEREAKTLQALHHPRIPRLLDFFHSRPDNQLVLTMVMEYVEGPSLALRLRDGWRPQESEVLEIARQGLEILKSLHAHHPPIIHRDIKPSNLIWTDDQKLYLIDFGAVREIFVSKGSSTVIGTFGYMAPEQFSGQSEPASDLYGLGATLLHLLAGRPPSDIPQKHLMPDFRPYVACSVELQRFLELLLVPDLEERLPDARKALHELKALTHHRENSPQGRLEYVREGQQVWIQLNPSLQLMALWQQHRAPMVTITAYLLALAWLYFGPRASFPEFFASLTYTIFFISYGTVSSIVLLLALVQLWRMSREHLLLRLEPDHLILERRFPDTQMLAIPRRDIAGISRRVINASNKLSRMGVSLRLKPESELEENEGLDIALGLGKQDQHWLMTKLVQYASTAPAMPAAQAKDSLAA